MLQRHTIVLRELNQQRRYPAESRCPSILPTRSKGICLQGTTTATAIQKRHLKSELALLQTQSRLFHLVQFDKFWRIFLKDCIEVQERKIFVLGAFYLSRNSGNSGRDMVMKHMFSGRSTRKFLGTSAILERQPSFPVGNFRWKCMFHLRIIGYSRRYLCYHLEFWGGDESINESKLSQMEHVIHSIDLFMEISERFW